MATDRAISDSTEAAEALAAAGGEVLAGPLNPSDYFAWKIPLGRILATLLLIPGIPIIAFLVLLVRLTSRGPGIYSQVRVGRNGRTFRMYKIRTMRHDAEATCGPEWTKKDDPRITRIGRFLRKLHLDEFPQLFNVLKGEMSLIGPRPERPEFTQGLAQEIPGYLDRLLVNPGITGLAQINLPPDTDLNSVRRKLVLDLEYIRDANVLLDIRMFISTLLRIMFINGDFVMKLMCLQRDVPFFPPSADEEALAATPLTPAVVFSHGQLGHLENGHAENGQTDNGHADAVAATEPATANGHGTPHAPASRKPSTRVARLRDDRIEAK